MCSSVIKETQSSSSDFPWINDFETCHTVPCTMSGNQMYNELIDLPFFLNLWRLFFKKKKKKGTSSSLWDRNAERSVCWPHPWPRMCLTDLIMLQSCRPWSNRLEPASRSPSQHRVNPSCVPGHGVGGHGGPRSHEPSRKASLFECAWGLTLVISREDWCGLPAVS